jgi:hypothetical protein
MLVARLDQRHHQIGARRAPAIRDQLQEAGGVARVASSPRRMISSSTWPICPGGSMRAQS